MILLISNESTLVLCLTLLTKWSVAGVEGVVSGKKRIILLVFVYCRLINVLIMSSKSQPRTILCSSFILWVQKVTIPGQYSEWRFDKVFCYQFITARKTNRRPSSSTDIY